MAIHRVQITLPFNSGLPEDVAVNTYHYLVGAGATAPEISDALDALISVYRDDTPFGGFLSIGGWLSQTVDRTANAASLRSYDLADPEPRSPIVEIFFTVAGPDEESVLPNEVAACISWEAAGESGVPVQRRRGRNYIGPLTADAIALDTPTGMPIVNASLIQSLEACAEGILNAGTEGSVELAVYSRADNVARPIVSGWIDNEFDTQRRRQQVATSRTSFTRSL